MKHFAITLVLMLLGPAFAPAQTREETIEFITSEFKAFESKEYMYKDMTFSPSGDSFTIRRSSQGDKDYVLTIPLKDVEIYKVTLNHANGINKFQLMVRNRGRETSILKDGYKFQSGPKPGPGREGGASDSYSSKGGLKITPAMENEKKCLALERAFIRLTMLTTSRKFLFYDPVVPR